MNNTFDGIENLSKVMERASSVVSFQLSAFDSSLSCQAIPFPSHTKNGQWVFEKNWSNGFFIGELWLLTMLTGRTKYQEMGMKLIKGLDHFMEAERFQDIGFLYYFSYALGYELFSEKDHLLKGLVAAEKLLECLESQGHLYCSWMNDNLVVGVDQMMNLNLLIWAWSKTKEIKFVNAINQIVNSTINYLIKSDASTFEYVKINNNGNETVSITKNAISDDSVWVRGHVWAIYGILKAAKTFPDLKLWTHAKRLTNYLFEVYDQNEFPWCSSGNAKGLIRDSSAAAAFSSILIQSEDTFFREKGKDILIKLMSPEYIPSKDHNGGGILRHASSPMRAISTEGESSIWGDYFLLEAIWHLLQNH